MRPALVSFALGCAWLQWQATLPSMWLVALLAFAAVGIAALPLRANVWRTAALALAAAGLGVAWSAGLAHWRLADELPAEWEGRDVDIIGVVSSLPQPFERGVRFEFNPETTLTPKAVVPQRLQLAWYGGFGAGEMQSVAPVHAGERWRLTVRLKKPHGNANPNGFDYEAFLLERGIRATGLITILSAQKTEWGDAALAVILNVALSGSRTICRSDTGTAVLCADKRTLCQTSNGVNQRKCCGSRWRFSICLPCSFGPESFTGMP